METLSGDASDTRFSMCMCKDIKICQNSLFLARLYESTGRAIAVTVESASASVLASASALALLKTLNFLVTVFRSLYLLNPRMDLVDTLPNVRYWSEVLCYTITTHISGFEVKGTDFEILS